jgi:protein-S-isoprenylcysteine O-methyltransferase Ste14
MSITYDPLYMPVFWIVIFSWFVFGAAFLFRKKAPATVKKVRQSKSVVGIILVGAGYLLVWSIRRPVNTPIIEFSIFLTYAIDFLAVVIAIVSIWFMLTAVRELGKQWNVTAILVEDHKLITSGPYHIVRHPIYLGMLGMLVATGIAQSQWYIILPGLAFAVLGTLLRVHFEEKLLLEAFGQEFESYSKNVPSLFPRIY